MTSSNGQNLTSGSRTARGQRSGFTLIELMIVIVIISLLIALLVPAVMSVMGKARDAQVKTEITNLSSAIGSFKAKYGMEPPSNITLSETPTGWDTRSRGFIRRMWPQFNFALPREFDGDPMSSSGYQTETHTLNGAECLVLFLGGVIDRDSGAFTGFSKNPQRPFQAGGNRVSPFFEFEGGLVDTSTSPWTWSGRLVDTSIPPNGAPEYLDPYPSQTVPYAYFSSYNGRGYRSTAGAGWVNTDCAGLMDHAYYVSVNSTNANQSQPYKPNSFQIISPGMDNVFGTGGLFDPDNTTGLAQGDRDNITNFHPGKLAP